MKRIINIIFIVLGTMYTLSCSKEFDHQEDNQPDGPYGTRKFKVSIQAPVQRNTDLTKALDLSGKKLTAYWEVGEQVAVQFMEFGEWTSYYIFTAGQIGTLSVTEVEGSWAIMEGEVELTDDMVNEVLLYPDDCYLLLSYQSYPYDWTGQDGTLETIAERYDFAEAYCNITGIEGDQLQIETLDNGAFFSRQSIIKFSILDKAGNPFCPTLLKISADPGFTDTYEYPSFTMPSYAVEWNESDPTYISVTPSGNTNEIYVSLPADYYTHFEPFVVEACLGDEVSVSYTKPEFDLLYGRYYSVNVKMPVVNLSLLEDDYMANDGDLFIGSTTEHVITIPDGATVSLFNATIEAPDGKAAVTLEGDAYIVAGGLDCYLEGGKDCPAIATSATGSVIEFSGDRSHIWIEGGDNAAGIGAGKDQSVGDITIFNTPNMGVSIAGGFNGAGIGGGLVTTSGITLGNIQVYAFSYGGFEIYGGNNAAGIGSGYASGTNQVSGGDVTVTTSGNRCSFEAYGGDYGAGIGSGYTNAIGNITVNFGGTSHDTIIYGGLYAAGIGCGRGTDNAGHSPSTCGTISVLTGEETELIIAGRSIDFTDSAGRHQMEMGSPGIGAGFNGSSCGDISIVIDEASNYVWIAGSAAASIGSSYSSQSEYLSSCQNINIMNAARIDCVEDRLFDHVCPNADATWEQIYEYINNNEYLSFTIKYHIGPTVFADPAPQGLYFGVMNGSVTLSGDVDGYTTDDGIGYYRNIGD